MGHATLDRISDKATAAHRARSPAGQAECNLVWHPGPLNLKITSPHPPELGSEVRLRVDDLNNIRCRT